LVHFESIIFLTKIVSKSCHIVTIFILFFSLKSFYIGTISTLFFPLKSCHVDAILIKINQTHIFASQFLLYFNVPLKSFSYHTTFLHEIVSPSYDWSIFV